MKTVLQLAAVLAAFLLSLAVSFWAGRAAGLREAPSGKPVTTPASAIPFTTSAYHAPSGTSVKG